ncbi:MAG: hypothetical protein RQ735_09340 [Flavobacteriaceae bacterium]|nr:hypothetical protein [Flavobacteriaceae bacterium]
MKRLYKILIFFTILLVTGIIFGYVYVNKTFKKTDEVRQEQLNQVSFIYKK